ncbi:hypothetical protein B0H10DRAFT_2437021 [Mycena sp. CBHHK59/15]|nr:hypothetical protein B0H10DRAFT_2437021 [Mycena sp. CBHHK59/15]
MPSSSPQAISDPSPGPPPLPTELLLEIISYYYHCAQGDTLIGRFEVLRALSQTCSSWRNIFLPLTWEHIEATGPRMKLLERRMTGILKTPSLTRYVRTLVVSLQTSSLDRWNLMTTFIRFLLCTPHLHTLRILAMSPEHSGIFSTACEPHKFPAVQTLALPASLSRMLKCFPNARSLACAEPISTFGSMTMLKAASKALLSVESLQNFVPTRQVIEYIAQNFPNIQSLVFGHIGKEHLSPLKCLKDLRSIEFRHHIYEGNLENLVDAVKKVLQSSPEYEQSNLRVQYRSTDVEYEEIIIVENGKLAAIFRRFRTKN